MKNKRNHLMWNMTRKCNFRCSYCYFPADTEPIRDPVTGEDVLALLEPTGEEWTIGMTGGEPFIYPGFVDICKILTSRHHIGVDTNLSVDSRVRQFADEVDPDRVEDLYIALHIEERERRGGVDNFIENVNLLQDKGFELTVNYVLHPLLLDRFERDRDFFGARGVKLTPRPFKGVYEGKAYPYAYDERVRALFAKRPNTGKKMVHNFYGVPCEAGRRLLRLEPDGTVMRCSGDRTVLGHVKTGATLYAEPEPCNRHRCPCFGPDWVLPSESQAAFMEGLKLFVLGKADEAAASFGRATDLDPDHSAAHNNMAVLHHQAGRTEEAAAELAQALRAHPDNQLYRRNDEELRSGGAPSLSVDVNPCDTAGEPFPA